MFGAHRDGAREEQTDGHRPGGLPVGEDAVEMTSGGQGGEGGGHGGQGGGQ